MTQTIAAIATPSGKGGVGIIRISGPLALTIAKKISSIEPQVRKVHFCEFKNDGNQSIDQGLLLYFKGPHSFTGEDVVELQAHGGPFILDQLLKQCIHHGAHLARPGEFSERAFLNDKIDLTQAEAIADLIDCQSERAHALAMRSLKGEFSTAIHQLIDRLIQLRVYVEAAIDFPDEEIDFLSDGKIERQLHTLIQDLKAILQSATQGALIREGFAIVLAGLPNAGKSTLLNRLAGEDLAIVTDIPGTTRDVMRQSIHIDGIPLSIIDTAGLRESQDIVEQEGIKRAWREIKQADGIVLLIDANQIDELNRIRTALLEGIPASKPILTVVNKIDRYPIASSTDEVLPLSAKTGQGLEALKSELKALAGFKEDSSESAFLARRRHLDALEKALKPLDTGLMQLKTHQAGELLAEDLRAAQQHLSSITGEFSADDLLGEIFSSFCIGK